MSDRGIDYILETTKRLTSYATSELKVADGIEPFMSLSFLSLVVIPELKINDVGLFDYSSFSHIDVEATE